MKAFYTVVTIGVFILVLIGGFLLYKKNGQSLIPIQSLTSTATQKITEAVLPQELLELTIPSLRQRTYQSSLGDLQKISQNSLYTSYLTAYTSDGLKINGLLTEPAGTPPAGGWPAIVFVHGYIPPTQYKTQERYAAYVDYLARNGFVVFKIDLRGHDMSEGTPTGAYYSSGYVIDTLNAYAALQSTSFVNPKEIGLWGHSMAGNIVMRSMTAKPDIPATVIWAGAGYSYEDLLTYRIHDNSYRPPSSPIASSAASAQLNTLRAQFNPTDIFWKEIAPTNYLTDLKGAIEIHHAIDDPVVSIEYSRELNADLDKTSVPHEFFEYPTGGHNITDPSFSKAMQRTVAFFKKYLKHE